MATLRGFAARIRSLGRRAEVNANSTVVAVATAVNQTVVSATPVDTGRARGAWTASLGSAATPEEEILDPSGRGTIVNNNKIIEGRKGKVDVYLSNNVEYIGFLNDGSSAQAPESFVEMAVIAGSRAARRLRPLR